VNGSTRQYRRSAVAFQEAAAERIPVHIGDVRIGRGATVLYTIGLGSCVAVAVYDAFTKIGGLTHAMLPQPRNDRSRTPAGRFVVTAVAELLQQMEAEGASRRRMRARIAGGASMFRAVLDGDGLHLGRRNVEAARAALEGAGVPVDGEEVFGTWGRSVFLRTTDGSLLVTSVSEDDVLL
jgi:chemotaxis protein CheD